jgi:hypothetical protein
LVLSLPQGFLSKVVAAELGEGYSRGHFERIATLIEYEDAIQIGSVDGLMCYHSFIRLCLSNQLIQLYFGKLKEVIREYRGDLSFTEVVVL